MDIVIAYISCVRPSAMHNSVLSITSVLQSITELLTPDSLINIQ
jgi:hypothetical protein